MPQEKREVARIRQDMYIGKPKSPVQVYPPPPKPERREEEPDEIDTLTADEIFKKFMVTSASSSRRSSIEFEGALARPKKIKVLQWAGWVGG